MAGRQIELSEVDMANIIQAIKKGELPHTEGFFFGVSGHSDEQIAEDVRIFENAIAWMRGGDESPFKSSEPSKMAVRMPVELKDTTAEKEGRQSVTRHVIYKASW